MAGNKSYYYSKVISKNIRNFRYMLGLSSTQFAERCGLAVERVMELEEGKNVAANGLELLRVAEGCNVRYEDLFDPENGSGTRSPGFNVKFPATLFKRIENWWERKGKTRKWVATSIDGRTDTISKWTRDAATPSPKQFSNLVALFNLKAFDLENMLKDESLNKSNKHTGGRPRGKKELEPVEEPNKKTITGLDEFYEMQKTMKTAEEEERKQTENDFETAFETRMLKIMKLQRNLDDVLEKLKIIAVTACELHEELEKLKGE